MSHIQQVAFCNKIKNQFPFYFKDKLVIDIGSLDINGANNQFFDNCLYIGVDIGIGKNVDFVTRGDALKLPDSSIDTIISTECFEHDMYYPETLRNIYRMLKPGGFLVFTCATYGRPEHGTRRTTPNDAPLLLDDGWSDYYKNLSESDIREVFEVDNQFSSYNFEVNLESQDLYFWGVKTGTYVTRDDYSFLVNNKYLDQFKLSLELKDQELQSKDQELQNKDQELQSKDQELQSKDQELQNKDQELQSKDQKLSDLLNSKSWRLTSPLRKILYFFNSKKE